MQLCDHHVVGTMNGVTVSVHCIQVDPEFFARLPSTDVQQVLLGQLVDLLLDGERSKIISAVKEKIRGVSEVAG